MSGLAHQLVRVKQSRLIRRQIRLFYLLSSIAPLFLYSSGLVNMNIHTNKLKTGESVSVSKLLSRLGGWTAGS